MALHEVCKVIGPVVGAHDQHEAHVPAVVSKKQKNLPDPNADADRGEGQRWEHDAEQETADIRQLEQEQQAEGQDELDEGGLENGYDFATTCPAGAPSV